jgi:Multiubiquitin
MDAVNGEGLEGAETALADVLEAVEEIIDELEIEAHAHTGRRKPRARVYLFRVGKELFRATDPVLTGRQILEIAHKLPPEKYILRQILHGGEVRVVGLDDTVDLRAPGVERFRAMPRTAQDG